MMVCRLGALGVVTILLAGCYPSNVIDRAQRGVVVSAPEAIEWRAADAESIPGLYVSERIEGEAAAGLIEVRYLFHRDGTYTGAALLVGDPNLQFQTLNGTWALFDNSLQLDGEVPGMPVLRTADRLRIESDQGALTLRRVPLP